MRGWIREDERLDKGRIREGKGKREGGEKWKQKQIGREQTFI